MSIPGTAAASRRGVNLVWSPEEDALLTSLWQQTPVLLTREIAARISGPFHTVTKNAAVGRAHRLGLTARASPIIKYRLPFDHPASADERRDARAMYAKMRGEPKESMDKIRPSRAKRRDRIVPGKTARAAAALETVAPVPVVMREPPRSSLTPGTGCLWPLWGNMDAPTQEFCGCARWGGSSYCEEHHRKAWVRARVMTEPARPAHNYAHKNREEKEITHA